MPGSETPNDRIALCLSGGGFRATLFHLGALKALRDYGALSADFERPCAAGSPPSDPEAVSPDPQDPSYRHALFDVTELYAVSGGSILAAHMIANWDRYIGDDTQFKEVENEILAFSQRNLRDRILRRWVLFRAFGIAAEWLSRIPMIGSIVPKRPGLYSRTYWLQQQYEQLFGERLLGAVREVSPAPTCHILTTSFTTGELCSFTDDHFDIEVGALEPVRTPCGHIRLSLPVAASSAFPPMFPPIELNDDMLANPNPPDHFERVYLSDGGVFDNLGIAKFLKNRDRAKNTEIKSPSTLAICDAGGSFRAGANKTFGGIFSRNVRASDILMHRIGDHAKGLVGTMPDVQDIPIRISTTCEDPALERSVQQRLRLVRTDFDRFDPRLARLLIEHGERVTHAAMKDQSRPRLRTRAPAPDATDVETADQLARKAANRSFRSLALGWSDWTLYPLALILAVLFAGSVWYVLDSQEKRRAAADAADAADKAKVQAYKILQDSLAARSEAQERKFEQAKFAYSAGRMDEVGRILTNGLNSASLEAQADKRNAENADAAASKLTALEELPAPVPTATASTHPQPVYIQFAGVLTRKEITDLNTALKAQGWLAQSSSGERTPKAAGVNEVRFASSNANAARELADAINAASLLEKQVEPRRVEIVGPKNLEVWISK